MDLTPFIYLILVIIALGLGVTITLEEVKSVLNYKVAFFIAMASQFGFMPFMGWALSRVFALNSGMSLGTIILCSSPGGSWSNFFCYHSGGNLSLSVSMTAFSTLIALGMMPFMIWLWADQVGGFQKGAKFKMDYVGLMVTLLLVVIPTIFGFFIRTTKCGNSKIPGCCCMRNNKVYEWLLHSSTVLGIFFILFAIIVGLLDYRDTIFQDWRVGIMVFLIVPLGTTFGYFVSRFFGLAHIEAVTVSFETGIQNVIIPLAIIELSFAAGGNPDKNDVLQPCLHYVIASNFTIVIIYLIFRAVAKQRKIEEGLRGGYDDSPSVSMELCVNEGR
jgi:BASS family bile acid:Na+ symporter